METREYSTALAPASPCSEATGLGALVGLGEADQDALIAMATMEEAAGRVHDALETLHVAASLQPLRARPWTALAAVLRRSGAHERAEVIETFLQGLNDASPN